MKYKILLLMSILIMALSTSAYADVVSDLQAQLKAVLDRISLLKSELALLERGGTDDGCLSITSNLYPGMQNSQIKELQVFLAKDPSVYPEAIISGYYGRLTQFAVQRWQAKHGVVSQGTPYTTGYGIVGPKTRKAMIDSCGSIASGSDNVIDFAFTTPSGQAPYQATAKLITLESACMSYKIDWGDDSSPSTYQATSTADCGGLTTRTLLHRYTQAGDYEAVLYAGKGSLSALPKVKSSYIKILAGTPTIKLIEPSGDIPLKLGQRTNIKWELSNQPKDSATALYIVTPENTYRFAKQPQTLDSLSWLVGDGVCDGNTCNVPLTPGQNYKIRAALYTPANACIDICTPQDIQPTFLSVDESSTFEIQELGVDGSSPITIQHKTGNAPYTTNIKINIEPNQQGVTSFGLDFGDGTPRYNIFIPLGETQSIERNIQHTFASPGTYTVKLIPTGLTQAIDTETITVYEQPFNIEPVSSVYAPATVRAEIEIDTTCVTTPNAKRVYTIDWGDDTQTDRYEQALSQCSNIPVQTSTSKVFTHNYLSPGTYRVVLSTKVENVTYKKYQTITIKSPSLSISPRFGFKPLTVTAKYTADESCVFENVEPATYTIEWGDGKSNSYTVTPTLCEDSFSYKPVLKEFTHTYRALGRYDITLTLDKNDLGSTRSSPVEVVVDTSVLRNTYRTLKEILNNTTQNLANAWSTLF